jgi:EpsI family protein
MSDHLQDVKVEDIAVSDRPPAIPPELPILPLRDTVLFPNSFMPLAVARESSVRLIDDAIAGGKLIGVFTQRDPAVEEPGQDDLYRVGTATHIHKMFKLPDGSLRLIVQGLSRLTLDEVFSSQPYLRARVTSSAEDTNDADHLEIDALARNIKTNFQQVVSLSPLLSDDLLIRRYARGDQIVWLCIVYHQNRRYGAHDPHLCYESQGYLIEGERRTHVDDGTPAGIEAVRFVADRSHDRRLVYYWWTTDGLTTSDADAFRRQLAISGALDNRSWGAFVRVEALVRGDDDAATARVLDDFAARVAQDLPAVLRDAAQRGADL